MIDGRENQSVTDNTNGFGGGVVPKGRSGRRNSSVVSRYDPATKLASRLLRLTVRQRLLLSSRSNESRYSKRQKIELIVRGEQMGMLIEQVDLGLHKRLNLLALQDLDVLRGVVARHLSRANKKDAKMSDRVNDPALDRAKKFTQRLKSGETRVMTADEAKKDMEKARQERDAKRIHLSSLLRPETP
jgi:chromosome segregation ATPase